MPKRKILVLAKLNNKRFMHFKHFITELSRHAHVMIWDKDRWEIGRVLRILSGRKFSPDFILYYDFAYNYALAPRVYGLGSTNIPKGVYYIDLQTQTEERKRFIRENKIDLVFSPTKDFFYRTLPELRGKFRWLPFSNNPGLFKDWQLNKDIDFLLMGRCWSAWYPFRVLVLKRMTGVQGFVYHKHPYETGPENKKIYTGKEYAKEINRAKIFFACGTKFNYPVRKYFEVPACNTLLIAKGNKDLKDLGFVSGKNFVECTDSNFYDLAMYYMKNDMERERIAKNGYNLVHSRHTDKIRVKEFLNMINQHLKNRKI
ncbi:MAG: glycosyltransferase [Bacillota bacterium]|nr:glycosyltransferase [Bacillota bacterium]MDD3298040.1 glycosyltransferase [Bacillota bacterium]MDD3850489.1 glycosyltransferase [Bacillota bacterium]MDD4707719.1 glycosyltransferase [Bacillota bacterium]